MESKIKKIDKGIPPRPEKSSGLDERPFLMMPPSTLPLVPIPFQVWKKPYSLSSGGAGSSSSGPGASSSDAGAHTGGYKTDLQPSDAGITNSSTVGADGNVQKSPNPSAPSDKNPSSDGGETAGAGGDNPVQTETVFTVQTRYGRNLDPNMDPRKLKRIISNRVSAQKSRMKKLQYVTDLENKAKTLEAQIAVLTPQVTLYRQYQQKLQIEYKSLNQQMTVFTNNRIITEAEIEYNKAEVIRLRQLHLAQQQQKMQNQARMPGWVSGLTEQMPNQNLILSGPGQMSCMNSNQAQIGGNTGETDIMNQRNMKQQQQQNPRQVLMPGWEPGLGQMPNPSMNQPMPQQEVIVNSNLSGIEQLLNYNPVNQNQSNCFK